MSKSLAAQEIANCTCLRLRRTARRVTQIYDQMLEPAGLPHILDIAYYGGVADIQRTGEAALHLPLVAVVAMPIELESNGKFEIEDADAIDRRTALMQLYRI